MTTVKYVQLVDEQPSTHKPLTLSIEKPHNNSTNNNNHGSESSLSLSVPSSPTSTSSPLINSILNPITIKNNNVTLFNNNNNNLSPSSSSSISANPFENQSTLADQNKVISNNNNNNNPINSTTIITPPIIPTITTTTENIINIIKDNGNGVDLRTSTSSTTSTSNTTTTTTNTNHHTPTISPIKETTSTIDLRTSTSSTTSNNPLKSSTLLAKSSGSTLGNSQLLKKSRNDIAPPTRHSVMSFLHQSISSEDHVVLTTSTDFFPPPPSGSLRATGAIPLVSITRKEKSNAILEEVKYGEDDDGATLVKNRVDVEGEEDDLIEEEANAEGLDIMVETGEIDGDMSLSTMPRSMPWYKRILATIRGRMGIVYMVISTFLFSLMAVFVKKLSVGTSAVEIAFIRSLYGMIGCLIILGSMRVNPLGDKSKRIFLTLRGLSGTISLTAYFFTLSVLPLSEAVCISFTSPVITAAGAAIVLKEKWGKAEALCAFLSLVGVAIISKPSFIFGSPAGEEDLGGHLRLLYILIGIGGACFSAVSFITVRKIGPGTNPFVLVFYFSTVSCIVLLPLSLITRQFTMPTGINWLYFTILGVVALLAQGTVNRGIQLEKAGKAASINYLQIVFTFIWELTFFHEKVDFITFIGAALILGCAGITAFRK